MSHNSFKRIHWLVFHKGAPQEFSHIAFQHVSMSSIHFFVLFLCFSPHTFNCLSMGPVIRVYEVVWMVDCLMRKPGINVKCFISSPAIRIYSSSTFNVFFNPTHQCWWISVFDTTDEDLFSFTTYPSKYPLSRKYTPLVWFPPSEHAFVNFNNFTLSSNLLLWLFFNEPCAHLSHVIIVVNGCIMVHS